jgi:nucleoid-associated protein YgaU
MALSRYRNLNTLEDKKYYESADFPAQEDLEKLATVQIVISQFDRLDNLAHIHLGDGAYWWVIAMLNGLDWPFKFDEGQILLIPTDIKEVLKLF